MPRSSQFTSATAPLCWHTRPSPGDDLECDTDLYSHFLSTGNPWSPPALPISDTLPHIQAEMKRFGHYPILVGDNASLLVSATLGELNSPREHHTFDNSACTRPTTPNNLHSSTPSVHACEDRFQTHNTLCILPHAYGDVPPYPSTVQNAPVLSILYNHSTDTPLLSTRHKQRRFRAILQVLVESTFSLIRCLLPSCGICLSFLQRILAHQNFRGVRNLTRVRHILTTKARLLVC